ncbi:MAG: decarboxylating 6-phosphogluconate dehydrogenase [Dehalococcoidia bacterium]|nr:decarboxylating 6-phosphogluconate dehydrogenase [Dehalococcoidia bacterium]
MQIGFIGLGRMGSEMVQRLLTGGFEVLAYDIQRQSVEAAIRQGAREAQSPADLVAAMSAPRLVWVMVPAGAAVAATIWGESGLAATMEPGDVIVDGGNSHYRDSLAHGEKLARRGIAFLDVGSSGGLEGARNGLSLTIGGEQEAFEKCRPVFSALAAPDGYRHVGPGGSGHFVKMVHNAIEYGVLQVLGEGLWLLEKSELEVDLTGTIQAWNNGSIIQSRLLAMCGAVFANRQAFDPIAAEIGGGSTGQWAIDEANRLGIPLPLITLSYIERLASRQSESFSAKVVAALRQEFGGHEVKTK